MRIPLSLIQEPVQGSRTVMHGPPNAPIFRGGGDITYACGGCGEPVAENVRLGQLKNMVLVCGHCGGFNNIP